MILGLKRVFLNENESVTAAAEVDMTDLADENGSFPERVRADITVSNHAGLVVYESSCSFRYRFRCARCYEDFEKELAYRFNHILVTALPEEGGDDYIEAPDYMLDTDALLRDDILLELPSKFLCKDSCKGLCPKCGKNLNEGACNCPTREMHPGFAALSELLEE